MTAPGLALTESYVIMSVKHTRRADRWITFWRPDNAGYAWRMDWVGRYDADRVKEQPGYYDNSHGTYAIPAAFVEARAVECEDDSGVGFRVPNSSSMRRKMVRAAIRARVSRARAAEALDA